MTKLLKDSSLLDGLPEVIQDQVWAVGIAKAVQNQIVKILEYAKITRLYASIDLMPEYVLDLMAIDVKCHEYSQDFDIDKKKSLIKMALGRWSKTGTKAVVEELCTKIFGDAHILEWFEYDGQPHYFKITCNNPSVTDKDVERFKKAIESVKRLSSWLDNIELILSVEPFNLYESFNLYEVGQSEFKIKGDTNRYSYVGCIVYLFNKEQFILN